jgi:hypothetical protein
MLWDVAHTTLIYIAGKFPSLRGTTWLGNHIFFHLFRLFTFTTIRPNLQNLYEHSETPKFCKMTGTQISDVENNNFPPMAIGALIIVYKLILVVFIKKFRNYLILPLLTFSLLSLRTGLNLRIWGHVIISMFTDVSGRTYCLDVYFLLQNIHKFSLFLTGITIHLRSVARNSAH